MGRESSIGPAMAEPSGCSRGGAAGAARAAVRALGPVAARGGAGAEAAPRRPRAPPAARQARHRPDEPDIHLGHTVVLRKLRDFQDAGHTVVLIVGDFTARVGDPSGRSAAAPDAERRGDRGERPHLPGAGPADPRPPQHLEVRHNSEWLDMPMADMLALARTTTVGQAARARRLRQAAGRRSADLDARADLPAARRLRLGGGRAPISSSAAPTRPSTCSSVATSSAPMAQPEQAILTMPLAGRASTASRRCPSRSATRSA